MYRARGPEGTFGAKNIGHSKLEGTFGAKSIGLSRFEGTFGATNNGLSKFEGTFGAKNIGLTVLWFQEKFEGRGRNLQILPQSRA